MDRLIKIDEVQSQTGLNRKKIYELIKQSRFPSPVKIDSLSRWSEESIQNWIQKQIRR